MSENLIEDYERAMSAEEPWSPPTNAVHWRYRNCPRGRIWLLADANNLGDEYIALFEDDLVDVEP